MREIEETILAAITIASLDVWPTSAGAVIQVALQITVLNTHCVAVTQLTASDLIETESVWLTFVTFVAGDVRWTNASARLLFTQGCRWAVTLLTIGEAVVAGAARLTATSDNIRLALALTTEWIALERR